MNRFLSSTGWILLAWAGVLAAGLALRVPGLDRRPMHADEANQAWKTGILWSTGVYQYDPQEHHGPTLYYLTLPLLWLAGPEDFAHTNEIHFRLLPALVGAGMVFVGLLLRKALGDSPVLLAGMLTALSPVMVFYSRYYIQEMLLVCFTLGMLGCLARWQQADRPSRVVGWAAGAGVCLGLMAATKETWILSVAAMFGAGALTWLWARWSHPQGDPTSPVVFSGWRKGAVLVGVGLTAALLTAGILYSGFGTHPAGLLDALAAYRTYLSRGMEAGDHRHSPLFYLHRLLAYRARGVFWTEGFILFLAGLGSIRAIWPRGRHAPSSSVSHGLVRFLTFYSMLLTVLYSAIPYKTPWCVLSFWHGMILLAGVGGSWIFQAMGRVPGRLLAGLLRFGVGLILAAGGLHLAWQSWALNFNPRFYADADRNPWVYAHTATHILQLADRMEQLASVSSEGRRITIHVIMPDNYWPVPWYLRRFDQERIGYWQSAGEWAEAVRSLPTPSVLILQADLADQVDPHLPASYNPQMLFRLRPEVFLRVYVREDLWRAFLQSVSHAKE